MTPLFSDREIRGLVLFLPLAGLLVLGVLLLRPKPSPEAAGALTAELEERADTIEQIGRAHV